MMLPSMAANFLFQNQFQLYFNSITGKAFSTGLFTSLFNNNLKVLMFCFIVSAFLGGGAIFIIAWNASLWGTIFGLLAKSAALTTGQNPWLMFGLIFLIVFPHMILEVSSYILAAVSGTMFSNIVVKMKSLSEAFHTKWNNVIYVLLIAVVVLVIGMAVETFVLNNISMYREILSNAFQNIIK